MRSAALPCQPPRKHICREADTAQVFQKRRIGQTDLEITTLGLGCASLAGNMSAVPAEQARATVAHGLDAGINYLDTAPQYGLGRSEHLVGDVLRARRGEAILSTKVGRLLKPVDPARQHKGGWVDPFPFDQHYDYSYTGIMRSFEDSLQRLGLNSVDIVYVHDIGVATHGEAANAPLFGQLADGGYRALRELRDSGQISAIGLGVNEWEVLMDAMDLGDWDVFLLAGRYTLLEQTALAPFMTRCAERGSSVVVGGPFNSGILAGGATFNYAEAPEAVVARVRAIETVCRQHGVPLPAAALQFPLFHPVVCNVLPGPRSPQELDEILEWWDHDIPGELWTALAEQGLLAPGTPIPGGTV